MMSEVHMLAISIPIAALILSSAGVAMKILDNRQLKDKQWTDHIETQLEILKDQHEDCERRYDTLETRNNSLVAENLALTRENLAWARQLLEKHLPLNSDMIVNEGRLLDRAEQRLSERERERGG